MTYGRPRTLDDVRRGEICALVSTGLTVQQAARYVRCSVKTIHRESQRNDEFRRSLHNAELAARLEPLKLVRQAAGAHWRAAAWLLERTQPERFAPRPAGAVRPEQVEDACHRLIEAALQEIDDPEGRRRAHSRLRRAVDAVVRNLFTPGRPRKRREPHAGGGRAAGESGAIQPRTRADGPVLLGSQPCRGPPSSSRSIAGHPGGVRCGQ